MSYDSDRSKPAVGGSAVLQLTWVTCQGQGALQPPVWCELNRLDLSTIRETDGVYVIWHGGNPGRVVRVGQGNIANRLSAHRNDPQITAYARFGTLFVTWAAVPAAQLDGVERYPGDLLRPQVAGAFPQAGQVLLRAE